MISPLVKRLSSKILQLRFADQRKILLEKRRLRKFPRFESGESSILGEKPIFFSDALSTLSSFNAIFRDKIYDLKDDKKSLRILDCGANIGLATIFLKQRFPDAKITAFEADAAIFSFLEKNIRSFEFTDIDLRNEAVWTEDGFLEFESTGGDAGKIISSESDTNTIKVKCVPLRDYLDEPIDLLKIDIEGAETDVLTSCSDRLSNVQRIFVEYHSFVNRDQNLGELVSCLEKSGFRTHIQPEMYSSHPFLELRVNHGMDNRINIFATRKA